MKSLELTPLKPHPAQQITPGEAWNSMFTSHDSGDPLGSSSPLHVWGVKMAGRWLKVPSVTGLDWTLATRWDFSCPGALVQDVFVSVSREDEQRKLI